MPVLLEHLKWNLQRFKEMLGQEATPYFRDAALQRFEFTVGSVLKCIAAATHQKEGTDAGELLNRAIKENLLPENTDSHDILESIDSLKPESRSAQADAVYAKLPGYYDCFEFIYKKLK